MAYGALQLEFYRVQATPDDFLMRSQVNETLSSPEELFDCLVIPRGDEVTDEAVARVGTLAEVVGGSPLPILPSGITVFSSALYGSFLNGDELYINSPQLWQAVYNAPPVFEAIVDDATNPNYPIVLPAASMAPYGFTDSLPAFGRSLRFKVGVTGDYFNDGLANRDYGASVASLFRTRDHGDHWATVALAAAAFEALKGEAQSLVNDYNADNWSGSSSERFE